MIKPMTVEATLAPDYVTKTPGFSEVTTLTLTNEKQFTVLVLEMVVNQGENFQV